MNPWRRALALGLALGLLAGTEVAVRLLAADPRASVRYVGAVPGWNLVPTGDNFEPGYTMDAYRMRSPGYPEPKGKAARVAFAGTSIMFGYKLEWDYTIAANFVRLRQSSDPRREYQVASCAAPGHSTLQTYLKLRDECLDWGPDFVVIDSLYNDASMVPISDRDRFGQHAVGRARAALEWFASFRVLQSALRPPVPVIDYTQLPPVCVGGWLPPSRDFCPQVKKEHPRVALDDYAIHLAEIVALVRRAGAEPILVMMPHITDGVASDGAYAFHSYRDAMRTVATETDTALIDARSILPGVLSGTGGNNDLMLDPVHPNARGAWAIARLFDAAVPLPE